MPRECVLVAFLAWVFLTLELVPSPVLADNWRASIYEAASPRHLVGVDKKRRLFNFFEKNSPFKLRYSYPCVTGQIPGDKQQTNDLRTPEGIYFVEYKIAGGLDFREYGGIAYTLNYPNPVDRLRGKTGHGIWIHSKGFGLSPTRGCVAIGLNNIAEVGPLLLPGTPVVMAEELDGIRKTDDGSLAKLKGLMAQWSKAWAARSPKMFDFYDPDAYSRGTENFQLFRQNKERLFKILSFIKIFNREIHALEGPGYWVTWSEQFYTASNLSTEGIRRLYWQKDKNGQFRIVGMEWTPRDVGMRAAFQSGTLVAESSPPTISDSEAPLAPRLDMPEQAPVTQQPETTPLRASLVALAQNLFAASEPLVPRRKGSATNPDEIVWGEGRALNESGKPHTDGAKAPQQPAVPAPRPAIELPAQPAPPEKLTVTPALQDEIEKLVQTWQRAYGQRNVGIDELYDAKHYNKLPPSAGVPRGRPLAAVLQSIKRDYKQPWLDVVSRRPQITVSGQLVKSTSEMLLVSPQALKQGVLTFWWRKNDSGQYRVVASEFKEEPLGLEANYLDKVSGPVSAMVEDWRKAWEQGNIDAYMSHYAPQAVQQGRSGATNIRRQKEQLWGRVHPTKVHLSGVRLSLEGNAIRADMTQSYGDSAGRVDKGVKTLLLRKDAHKWLIHREEWADVSTQPTP